MNKLYVKITHNEAQYFMKGAKYESKDLHQDPFTDDWFVPQDEYNKLVNKDPYKV